MQGYPYPKLYRKRLSNQKPTVNTARTKGSVQEERLHAQSGVRLKNFYLSKFLCALFFSKQTSTKQNIASTEISYQFIGPKVHVFEEK